MPARNTDMIGITKVMNNGQKATIIGYTNSKKMTIQFEDGTIKEDVYKVHFDAGKVSNPNLYKNKRIGEVRTMSNGQKATVMDYRNSADIDVQFEDGTIVTGVSHERYSRGAIANPTLHKYQARVDQATILGLSKRMNCGLVCRCINYRDSQSLDVEFEDGLIVVNRSKSDFLRGEIAHPMFKYNALKRGSILGSVDLMNCGMFAKVVEDNGYDKVVVQFEDGTLVYDCKRNNFRLGQIVNPNYDRFSVLGIEIEQNCGMSCKCISYRNTRDLDVCFADGTELYNRTKVELLNGTIQNPNFPRYNSLPQSFIFYFIKKYFPDAVSDYRPNWLENPLTNRNLELDIWIPSIKLGIEYDGYVRRHLNYSLYGDIKSQLISSSKNIDSLLMFCERGVYTYNSKKYTNIELGYVSKKSEYPKLLNSICVNLQSQLEQFGIFDSISPSEIDSDYINFNYHRFLSRLKQKLDNLQ